MGYLSQTAFVMAGLVWLASCGTLTKTTYRAPGGDVQRSQKQATPSDPVPLSEERPPVAETRRDDVFDTGLDACVKAGLSAAGKPVFAPRLWTASAPWLARPTTDNNESFFRTYDLILRDIVTPAGGLVAYSRLRNGGDLHDLWTSLVAYLPRLSFDALTFDAERQAFWVNIYNLVMIDILTENPDALSFVARRSTFGDIKRNVGGTELTLDAIEYGILGLGARRVEHGVPASAVPKVKEARLHVALVCGAISCPKLRNFAYDADFFDVILEENAHMFFNNRDKHVKNEGGSFQLSSLFKWFAADFDTFGGVAAPVDLSRYFLAQCRDDVAAARSFLAGLSSFRDLPGDNVLFYDWAPNERPSP